MVEKLAEKKGAALDEYVMMDYQKFKEQQYDKLADILRQYLDMGEIYGMLKDANLDGF